jgi:AcrR family transcriptional regulator
MSPAKRREMIVRSILPLVAEQGTAVTSSQLAEAAGIGEATIFRVFKSKAELLDACLTQALRPDDVLATISAISLDEPLPSRLHQAATALQAHAERMGRVLSSLHATGHVGAQPSGRSGARHSGRAPSRGRQVALSGTRDAVAALFAPERKALRLPADHLATVFLSMLFNRPGAVGNDDHPPLCTETLILLFLHGALSEED